MTRNQEALQVIGEHGRQIQHNTTNEVRVVMII